MGRSSPLPGSPRIGPIHIPSDSDSEKGLFRKRRYDDSSSESDTYNPPKRPALSSPEALTLLKDIKFSMDRYHQEVQRIPMWNELDEKKSSLIFALNFACLICKDVVSPESAPVMPPCCRAAVMCKECLLNWLDNQQTCPHCR